MDSTLADKYLILSTTTDTFLNDLGSGYIREFMKNGAAFIDYEHAYMELGNKGAEELIMRTAAEKGAEVLIYQSGPSDFHFSVEFFSKLRKKLFTVMMLGDSDHYFELRDVYYGQCMDLVVVYDCLSRYRFRQYGINALSFYSSFDGAVYAKEPEARKDIDVSFVGDIASKLERMEYIEFVRRSGVGLQAFGNGSEGGQVSLEEMVRIFNRSSINLNFTRISLKNAIRREPMINLRLRQVKGRIAEIALSGGFVLTEYVPGIEEVFEVGTEVETFDSKEELLAKIRYYLAHHAEREQIAERGHSRAMRDYDVRRAIPRLVERINSARTEGKPPQGEVFVDPQFTRSFATFRAVMFSRLIRRGRWSLAAEEISMMLALRNINIKKAAAVTLFGLFPILKKMYLGLAGRT